MADLGAIEALVRAPDVTELLTLDESERVRRLRARGGETAADIETLDARFRAVVLDEMHRPRRAELRPTEVDVTSADPSEALRRVVDALPRWSPVRES